jgi:arginyl-tRNA synthetase
MNPVIVIRESVEDVVRSIFDGEVCDFLIERPSDESHGDFATNVALVMFKKGKFKSPRELAEKIKSQFLKNKEVSDLFEKVEVAGPGFINFYFKQSYFLERMNRVDKNFGKDDWGKGKRILVDYSSPNIAKDFSVGHLRSTIIGQAIRNLYEFCGFTTVGDNHLGDWGTQFGMIIAAVEEAGLDIEKMSVSEMEELYVKFNQRVKEDEGLREKAKEAFVRLEKGDSKALMIWKKSIDSSMKEFDKIYDLLGVKIEHSYGEGFYVDLWGEIIENAKKLGLAKRSEGALVMDLSDDLPPGMFLKSDGGTTYFTRDLATIKFRQDNPALKSDLYVYEVGEEQTLHFKQVFVAAEKLGFCNRDSLVHVAHGLVLGDDGKKMSTRKGTGMKMGDLLEKAIEKAGKINRSSAEIVGVGAVKYFDLKHSPQTTYKFKMEDALSLDGNSGPYLQYALVRIKSVLSKVDKIESTSRSDLEVCVEEMNVLRCLDRFPETVMEAAKGFAPNLICNYLFELAQRFNAFYNKYRILEGENREFKLRLTLAVKQVLSNGLELLGIEVPEKM